MILDSEKREPDDDEVHEMITYYNNGILNI